MKTFLKSMIGATCGLLFTATAWAVCPVCVVSVGILLEIANLLGVDVSIVGIWSGALVASLFVWTMTWLRGRGISSVFWSAIVPAIVYYGMLFSVYLFPNVITYGAQTIFGIDKLFLGIIVGTIALIAGDYWYVSIKRRNGGHAQFPFQKVAMPILTLIIVSVIFWIITK